MSDLKDEILILKTAVSDVNKGFEKLSKGLESVSDLGDKSKDSAELVETLGKSASEASTSLTTLSSKMESVKMPDTEVVPTARSDEGYEYISEDSDVIKDLVEKTDHLIIGVNGIEQNILEMSEGLVTAENFNDFKKEISNSFEEVGQLKESIDTLNSDMILNKDYTVESKKQFEVIFNKLQTYDTTLTTVEENISFMDHRFTDAIAELHEKVNEAMNQAWAAYNFASRAVVQI